MKIRPGHAVAARFARVDALFFPSRRPLPIGVTIGDPKAYLEPFTVRVGRRIMLNTGLIEFICNENEQSSRYYVK